MLIFGSCFYCSCNLKSIIVITTFKFSTWEFRGRMPSISSKWFRTMFQICRDVCPFGGTRFCLFDRRSCREKIRRSLRRLVEMAERCRSWKVLRSSFLERGLRGRLVSVSMSILSSQADQVPRRRSMSIINSKKIISHN